MTLSAYLSYYPFRILPCILVFICLFTFQQGFGQVTTKNDSAFLSMAKAQIEEFKSESDLDPNRAAFYSAILPGLGQAYNNQYWKIPLIYGGGIIIGHYINYNHKLYWEFDHALRADLDNDPNTNNPYADSFRQDALNRNRELFRRNRDFLIIIAAAFYLLNVVDAHVSAHLHEFEINDKLSMNINPSFQSTPLFSHAVGVSVSLSIK